MSDIRADEQRLAVGTVVSLYAIDASAQGGGVLRFAPGPWNGARIVYAGVSYAAAPIRVRGVGSGGDGAANRPRLEVGRLDSAVAAALVGADQWQGAKVTRLRTLERYLDGAPEADPERHWPLDVWWIERLAEDAPESITWQLAGAVDLDSAMLPGRQMLADCCHWRYRRWDPTGGAGGAGAWDYSEAECPYTGSANSGAGGGPYYNAQDEQLTGQAARPQDDVCSRRISGCRARFPDSALPFGGFVGLGRLRRR